MLQTPTSADSPQASTARVVSFMTSSVTNVRRDTPLRSVLEKMEKLRISCIVVCEEMKPVGIVTERDLLKLLRVDLDTATAADVMTAPLVTIHAQDGIDEAVVISQTRRIRHFPVVNDFDALVGILTQTDLLRAQSQTKP